MWEDFFMKNFLLSILMLCSVPAYATSEAEHKDRVIDKNYIGVGGTAGSTTGVGLSFRHHIPYYGIGYQLTAGGFGSPTNFLVTSWGLQTTLTFASMKYARIYALVGTASFLSRTYQPSERYCNWDEATQQEVDCETMPDTFVHGALTSIGAGLGIEFLLWDTIGLAFDLPLSVSLALGDQDGLSFVGLFPIPNASLIYYF